jgi:hypothetical protein
MAPLCTKNGLSMVVGLATTYLLAGSLVSVSLAAMGLSAGRLGCCGLGDKEPMSLSRGTHCV